MIGVTGLCSCGIGRRIFRGSGGAGEAGRPFGDGDLLNIERTLWIVFLREGALRVVDGVGGGLRRKSVRMSLVG